MNWLVKIASRCMSSIYDLEDDPNDVTRTSNWDYKAYGPGFWILKANRIYAIDADDPGGRFLLQENNQTIYAGTSFEDCANKLSEKLEGLELDSYVEEDENKLREKFLGYTENPKEAGYITIDGKMLNLSGAIQGGPPGQRGMDHRYFGGTKGMQEYVAQGNIRMGLSDHQLFFDIRKKPTSSQMSRIRSLLQWSSNVSIDMQNGLGEFDDRADYYLSNNRISKQYDGTNVRRVLLDINTYFAESKKR